MGKKFAIKPHPDIELGFERKELEYFLTFPSYGINSDTGVILCICPCGHRADSEYQKDKLRPYLANKYNCIAVGVNYFGIGSRANSGGKYILSKNFLYWLNNIYGIKAGNFVTDGKLSANKVFAAINKKNIKQLAPLCKLLIKIDKGEYQSFGFLPAIDHLQVLGEILRDHPINKRRIIAFGSSYSGYIALLLGKYAPYTFSAIIDNSGFVQADLDYIVGDELYINIQEGSKNEGNMKYEYAAALKEYNISAIAVTQNPWTIKDETSICYFSDSHRHIRSLLIEDHINSINTKYYIFHSGSDMLVTIDKKNSFVNLLKNKGIRVYYKIVSEPDIDGRIFKNLSHGMNASLREVFNLASEIDNTDFVKEKNITDFDIEGAHDFDCGEWRYMFNFNKKFEITVKREKKHKDSV
jgi:hypothetical protein